MHFGNAVPDECAEVLEECYQLALESENNRIPNLEALRYTRFTYSKNPHT